MINKKRHNHLRDELARCFKRYGDMTYKEVDGLALLDTGATFDIVNFGVGSSIGDELIDVCIFNHASSKCGLSAGYTKMNRRRPAMRREQEKRRNSREYPAGCIGKLVQNDLNILAVQEHGAIGPEGRRLLLKIGKRAAQRSCNTNINQAAKIRQEHLLRRLTLRFFEDIAIAHRMVLTLGR
jgi:hypothetical protein